MPRGPRIDGAGMVHHVMARGIERGRIFVDDRDCEDLLGRLDRLIPELGFVCFAWALLPNHLHLVLRTGEAPLPRLMARLLTGYAKHFNQRHDRVGHVFQNRYRTRIITDDADLAVVVVYVVGNPWKHGIARSWSALRAYPWGSASGLLGARPLRPFERTDATLPLFGRSRAEAAANLRRRLDHASDARIEPAEVRPEVREVTPPPARPALPIGALRAVVCREFGIAEAELASGSRRALAIRARRALVLRASRECGAGVREIATAAGISRSGVSRILLRSADVGSAPGRSGSS